LRGDQVETRARSEWRLGQGIHKFGQLILLFIRNRCGVIFPARKAALDEFCIGDAFEGWLSHVAYYSQG